MTIKKGADREASIDRLVETLERCLVSPNVADSNGEPANLVDVIDNLSYSAGTIARAITPVAAPGHDAAGGTVISLTEAVMGITAGLFAISVSIDKLAEAVEGRVP